MVEGWESIPASGAARPAPGATPDVLIGIPSFRRADGLRNLLSSLQAQQGVDELSIAVFVADNDPRGRDGAKVAEQLAATYRWPLRCCVVEEPGISAVRNAILDQARSSGAEFVAMLDDDEVAEPGWLSELVEAQRQTCVDVVGGPVLYRFENQPGPAVLRSGYFSPRRWPAGPVPLLDQTGNVLLSCRTLERLGWPKFDLSFGLTGGGDKEYFTRLKASGVRFAWAPRAISSESVPPSRLTRSWVLRRAFRVGNADMRISVRHAKRAEVIGSAAKALTVLLTLPLTALLLLLPAHRISIMAKWSRATGKLAVFAGRSYREYGRPPAAGAS